MMVVNRMINSRFSVAVHILTVIGTSSREVATSEWIAKSVQTNPVVIRRISSMLKKAGLLISQTGKPGASLTKDSKDISLLDIYTAVEPERQLFSIHENPNDECPIGKNIQQTLAENFSKVQKATEHELAKISLEDIILHLHE